LIIFFAFVTEAEFSLFAELLIKATWLFRYLYCIPYCNFSASVTLNLYWRCLLNVV